MLLISANPMSARNVNVSLCACRRRCSRPQHDPGGQLPKMPAMPAPRQREQRANERHQEDHRQPRETHPDHLRRRTEQPDATANIDRHNHPASMLVAGVR